MNRTIQPLSVAVRDGLSQVRSASAIEAGWEIVSEVDNQMDGWSLAARIYGASPLDYADGMRPRPFTDLRVLYRSVSIPEIADIFDRGTIEGGANIFNSWDRRPFVFFGEVLTERLIWQGEDITRQANYAAVNGGLGVQIAQVNQAERDWRRGLIDRAQNVVATMEPEWKKMIGLVVVDWADFTELDKPLFLNVLRAFPDRKALTAEHSSFAKQREQIQISLNAAYHTTLAQLEAERPSLPASSVVIETRPVTGGLHYSRSFGSSGHGDEDEFGLFPGQLQIADIVRLHWVREKTIVHVSEVSTFSADIEQMVAPQQNFGTSFKS